MKRKIIMKKLILFPCMPFLALMVNAQQTDFPGLTGSYLGQKAPDGRSSIRTGRSSRAGGKMGRLKTSTWD